MNKEIKKYFEYADGKARALFAEYAIKKAAYDKAKEAASETPIMAGITTLEYKNKALIANGRLKEAEAALKEVSNKFPALHMELKRNIKDLEKEIENATAADPAKLDKDVIFLLESGILKAGEYASLYNNASGNPTMQRIIKKYIDKAAEETNGAGDMESINLRIMASQTNGDNTLDEYEVLLDTFERTISNKGMITYWDELCGSILEEE